MVLMSIMSIRTSTWIDETYLPFIDYNFRRIVEKTIAGVYPGITSIELDVSFQSF